jgi:hypothetical protein
MLDAEKIKYRDGTASYKGEFEDTLLVLVALD